MKTVLLAALLAFVCSGAYAQSHAIYTIPGKDAKTITVLGSDPEFHPLQNLKNKHQVYVKLKEMGNSPRYRKYINSLFTAMGYSGVNDPNFTENDVNKGEIPYGAIGMMGDGSHHYEYCKLNVAGDPYIPSWRVRAENGNDLHFMSRCGNAFYYPQAAVSPKENCPTTRVQVFARYKRPACSYCPDCGTNDPEVKGSPFTQTYQTETVLIEEKNATNYTDTKAVYVDVDRRTFRKLKEEKEERYESEGYGGRERVHVSSCCNPFGL